jgi:glycosyltransferase involved in cell wall biosynthesis
MNFHQDIKCVFHIATDMSSEWYGVLADVLGSKHKFFHIVKKGDPRRALVTAISRVEGNRVIAILSVLKLAWWKRAMVIFHSAYPYVYLMPLLRCLNIEYRFIVRSSDYLVSKRNLYSGFLVRKAFSSKRFLFKSLSSEKSFKIDNGVNQGESSAIYLSNPIRRDFYEVNSYWCKSNERLITILVPAQVSKSKNISAVVEFGKILATDFQKLVTVDIVGELVDPSYLMDLKKLAGEDVVVKYCSKRLNSKEMIARYLSSSVVFQLAHHETLGMCFIEAALLGVPCVALEGSGIHGTPPYDQFISFAKSDAFDDLLESWQKAPDLVNANLARELRPSSSKLAELWEIGLGC